MFDDNIRCVWMHLYVKRIRWEVWDFFRQTTHLENPVLWKGLKDRWTKIWHTQTLYRVFVQIKHQIKKKKLKRKVKCLKNYPDVWIGIHLKPYPDFCKATLLQQRWDEMCHSGEKWLTCVCFSVWQVSDIVYGRLKPVLICPSL